HLGHRGRFLPDGHVDALDLLLGVARGPVVPLVDDGVDGDGRLAGLPVADDQLALAPPDGRHAVDGLDPGLKRLLHRLPLDHGRRLDLEGPELLVLDGTLAVHGVADRVDHATQDAVALPYRQDSTGLLDL